MCECRGELVIFYEWWGCDDEYFVSILCLRWVVGREVLEGYLWWCNWCGWRDCYCRFFVGCCFRGVGDSWGVGGGIKFVCIGLVLFIDWGMGWG